MPQAVRKELVACSLGLRQNGQILPCLQDVLHPARVPRHEGHHLPAGAHIEQVVAESEIKELPLPDLAAVVAALLIAEIILVYGVVALNAVGYGLVPHAAVLLCLALKGKRQHSLEPAALHVNDYGLSGVIRKVLFCAGHRVLE